MSNTFKNIIEESLSLLEDEYISLADKYKQLQQQRIDADKDIKVSAPNRYEANKENYKELDNYLNNFIVDDSVLGKFAKEWQNLKSRDLNYKPQEYKYIGKYARKVPIYKGSNPVGEAKEKFFNSLARFLSSQEYYDYLLGHIRNEDEELYNKLVNIDLFSVLNLFSKMHPEVFVLDAPLSKQELDDIKKHLEVFSIRFPSTTSFDQAKQMILNKYPEKYYYTQISDKYATDKENNKLVLQVKMLNPNTVNIED